MLLIIPLGGLGERFSKLGYLKPKPLINVFGKPIIFWLLDNLDLSQVSKVVIPYHHNLMKYYFEDVLRKTYSKVEFIFIPLLKDTLGASDTILHALNYLEELKLEDESIISLDGDNFYTGINLLKEYKESENKNKIIVFKDESLEPIYSYVKLENDKIIEMKEKVKISDYACSGGYAFESWKRLREYCKKSYDNKLLQKGELYMSGVVDLMIHNEINFNILEVKNGNFICLGTPLQVRLFCNNFPRYEALHLQEKIKPKRFCFDLDGTLVSYPKINGDYSSVEPIEKNINVLRYLKNFGHTIIIYTARRMKSCNGNIGKVVASIGKTTFETLEKFNIPYDEIYFGKPIADYYIDDLAINAFDDLEKELGFYSSHIEPRSFNSVEDRSINLYRKSSKDINKKLDGEIYYYNNIPLNVKDLFPLMIRYDEINYNWYDMERVNGIPISKLYLGEEMTIELLEVVLKSVERLHQNRFENKKININDNYVKKLKERWEMFDYSDFKNSDKIYQELIKYFENYELNKLGECGMIHGDPVFTNILINQFGKLKLIDMRGKIGKDLSIYGDIYYDYGKIYQSLTGYEEIIGNKKINLSYKNKLIEYFEKRMGMKMERIRMIKKMLLFTLIPLHQGEDLDKFYQLI
jgi:capsule biosynthesis phosphatase